MRAMGFGFVGLALGAIAGFWLGLMAGLIYVELADVTCFEGLCSARAARFGAFGALACGVAGAIYGFCRALRREPAASAA